MDFFESLKSFFEEKMEKAIQSWLAYSATNIVMHNDKLLLGKRRPGKRNIPENGHFCLIGGFNDIVPGPAMFADVANAHLKGQFGIDVDSDQCSEFMVCEYPMVVILEPLNTLFGALNIKRVAFDRIVTLTDEQAAAATVPENHPKLDGFQWVTEAEFEEIVASGECSFPYQVEHVRMAFRSCPSEAEKNAHQAV